MTQNIKHINIIFVAFLIVLLILLGMVWGHEPPEERIVLLSFDVEPIDGDGDVLEVLSILERQNVTATFFVTGEYAAGYQQVVRRMDNHEVACHSMTHPVMTGLNHSQKEDELLRCRRILESLTGKKVKGYRSPYHRIDAETYDILESEGFVYDATIIRGIGFAFPSVGHRDIGEIPVSSVLGLPIEDVVWTHYLKMPSAFFYILRNKESELESYVFHPHHIAREAERFEEFIKLLKKENVKFISHSGLIEMDDEGV
jgi:peptidoglycan/xylan/chitin deacetylase (PgdA/CDA1 family)